MDRKLLEELERTLANTEISPHYKGMIYGPDGVGKTIAAAKVANAIGDKTLYWKIDPGGPDSFFNHPELGYGSRIRPIEYGGLSQMDALGIAFREKAGSFGSFDTLIVDTASNAAVLRIDTVTQVRVDSGVKRGGVKQPFDYMEDMYGVYNQSTYDLRTSFLKLLLSPIHIILIAHDRRWEDKEGGGIKYTMPAFTPEVYKAISRLCSQVIYMTADLQRRSDKTASYVRTMQFHPTGGVVAKSHIGGLPVDMKNPDLGEIILKWRAAGGMLTKDTQDEAIPEALVQDDNEFTLGIG